MITLGSPFALTDARQAGRARRTGGASACTRREATRGENSSPKPLPVPSAAVYSRHDGIMDLAGVIAAESGSQENIEVRCAHLGFGTDPATLWAVADRLAVPAGQRRPFRPPPALRSLYPGR